MIVCADGAANKSAMVRGNALEESKVSLGCLPEWLDGLCEAPPACCGPAPCALRCFLIRIGFTDKICAALVSFTIVGLSCHTGGEGGKGETYEGLAFVARRALV